VANKTERVSLRLTKDVYNFIKDIAKIFDCSFNEAINKVLVLAQVVYNTELKDLMVILAQGYEVELKQVEPQIGKENDKNQTRLLD